MAQKKLLIIGYVWVEPHSSAAGSRMLELIEVFHSQNWEIIFASPAQRSQHAKNLTAMGIEEVSIELNNSSFDTFLKNRHPDVVLFDRFMIEEQFGWRVAEICPEAIRILDTEDLHSLRKAREQAIRENRPFDEAELLTFELSKREMASIFRSDLALIISRYEMVLLKQLFQIDRSLLHHIPFLLEPIDKAQIDSWKNFEDRVNFVFMGNGLHAPNVDAILQLKKIIWPIIRSKLPKVELHLYVSYATQQINDLHNEKERFLIKGSTNCPDEIVGNSRVVLAPLRFGAGIKGKLTEAMICGTPSMTTMIGAEGMHADLPWNGFIEDDLKIFAEEAVALYTNKKLWQRSQQNGVQLINELYDKKLLAQNLLDRIEEIQENLSKHRKGNFIGAMLQHHTLQSTKYLSRWIEAKNA